MAHRRSGARGVRARRQGRDGSPAGMESAIRWLRASYLAGAFADGLVGVLMLWPQRMGRASSATPWGSAPR